MDFQKNSLRWAQAAAAFTLLFILLISSCRLMTPRNQWKRQWGPIVPHNSFPADCGICHLPERWDKLRDDFAFDHAKETGYPLNGAHSQAACLRCHNDRGPVQTYVARGCSGCHLDPHESSMGLDCSRCHTEFNWRPSGLVAEHARTRFPLIGNHAVAACESCHEGAAAGQFRGESLECAICHRSDMAETTDPNHLANGWTKNCQRCHSPVGWNGAEIKHDFFPLNGGHAALNCIDCHAPGTFIGLSQDCNSCHSSDYQQAPNHVAGSYPRTCEQCHSISGWQPARFDHSFFPLTGAHAQQSCTACHVGGVYTGLSSDCNSCHSSDFQQAPNHVSGSYPRTCEQCHTTTGWSPATFDHSFFPLTGQHAGRACTDCHSGDVYTGLSSDCNSCHSSDFQQAPNHVAGNYPRTCEQCHTTTGWTPAAFDHSFFALTGGHSGLACSDCHAGGVYAGLNSSCYSCHQSDYQQAPDHAALGFPTDCESCHTINAWKPTSFNHQFPLTGDHNLSCIECHNAGSTTVFSCIDCHEHRQTKMADEHKKVNGYTWSSPACYNCHPRGKE